MLLKHFEAFPACGFGNPELPGFCLDGDSRGLVDSLGQLVQELLFQLFVHWRSRHFSINPTLFNNAINRFRVLLIFRQGPGRGGGPGC